MLSLQLLHASYKKKENIKNTIFIYGQMIIINYLRHESICLTRRKPILDTKYWGSLLIGEYKYN